MTSHSALYSLLIVLSWVVGAAHAQSIQLSPEYFRISDFKLQSGQTLKEMIIEYATLGEPKRDASGAIVKRSSLRMDGAATTLKP